MSGLSLRLRRLQPDGYYAIVAADHGLSAGFVHGIEGLADIESLIRLAAATGMGGVVVNYAIARKLREEALGGALRRLSLIVQIYGRPGKAVTGGTRQPLCSVEDAVAAGADCVSFQIESGSQLADADMRELGEFASRARRLGIPAVLMAGHGEISSAAEFVDLARAVAELPVDLVKLDPRHLLPELPDGCLARCPAPCLYAGGPLTTALAGNLRQAAAAGFQGICLGRNFFQAADPHEVACHVREAFSDVISLR